MKVEYLLIAALGLGIAACTAQDNDPSQTESVAENESTVSSPVAAPAVTFTPAADTARTAKPTGPVTIAYKLIGKPVIGQPLTVELHIRSSLGDAPIRVDYRITDATALTLAESQNAFENLATGAAEESARLQVAVVPLRQGRAYLNVSASIATDDGSLSTVTAIPIAVGESREKLRDNGKIETDADGNAVRVLESKERN
jgi:hypothetical protein